MCKGVAIYLRITHLIVTVVVVHLVRRAAIRQQNSHNNNDSSRSNSKNNRSNISFKPFLVMLSMLSPFRTINSLTLLSLMFFKKTKYNQQTFNPSHQKDKKQTNKQTSKRHTQTHRNAQIVIHLLVCSQSVSFHLPHHKPFAAVLPQSAWTKCWYNMSPRRQGKFC